MSAPLEQLAGTTVQGRYRLVEELGRGGTGAVFRALDEPAEAPVALKIALAPGPAWEPLDVTHPNLVRAYASGALPDGRQFLVMELLEGQTLAERIEAEGHVREAALAPIAAGVAAGLSAAHAAGRIHGDLKPANVFLAASGPPRLLDFGLRCLDDEGRTVLGTPHYLAPEQARGEAQGDPRVDVWAMGVLLYEAATGVLPFNADTYVALVDKILHRAPLPPRRLSPELSDGFEALILQALQVDPARRPSADALADVLAAHPGGAA